MANGQYLLNKYVDSTSQKSYLLSPVFSYNVSSSTFANPQNVDTITKIMPYSGTKPTAEQNGPNTLYVSRQ